MNPFADLLALFYPELCLACEAPLVSGEQHCCTDCRVSLPYLSYHLPNPAQADSPLVRRFWGKVPVRYAVAYLQFTAQGRVQHLLHQLKYERQPEIGEVLGRWFGAELAAVGYGAAFDVVVPVPLHPVRLVERGFDQAALLAGPVAGALRLPLATRALERMRATPRQASLDRAARVSNVATAFRCLRPRAVAGRRVLLVDDVRTTGATLAACASALLVSGAATVVTLVLASRDRAENSQEPADDDG